MMTGQSASGRNDAYLRNNSNNSVWDHPAMQLVRTNASSMWNHPAMQLIRSNASNMRNHPAIQLVREHIESLWNHPAVRSVRSSVNSIRNHSAGELIRSNASSVWNHPAVQRVRSNANSVWNHPAVQRVRSNAKSVWNHPAVQRVRSNANSVWNHPAVQRVRSNASGVWNHPTVQRVRSTIQTRLQRNREILSANILTILQGIIVRLILLGITYKLRQSSLVKQLIEIHWDPRMDYCVIPQFAELIAFIVMALIHPSSAVSSELWFWACILVFLLAALPAVCLLEETHNASATSIFGSWGRVSFPYRDPDDRGEILQGWLKIKGEMCYLNGPNGNCTNEAFLRMFDADERVAANDDQNENKTEKSDEKENSDGYNFNFDENGLLRNLPKEKMVYADYGYGVRHKYGLRKLHDSKHVERYFGPQYDGAYGCGIWCLKICKKGCAPSPQQRPGGHYDRENNRREVEYVLVDSASYHAAPMRGHYDREQMGGHYDREQMGGHYDRENNHREQMGGHYDRENNRREQMGGHYDRENNRREVIR